MKYINIFKNYLFLLFTILTLTMLNMNNLDAQTVDTCDNGGFEQDFLYYTGDTARFRSGSDFCSPLDALGNPSTFGSITLPTSLRFEIVNVGVDPLVGIQRVKFDSKALRLNNQYGHANAKCVGRRQIDRITKQFTVTSENREFTVWYALVLENPSNKEHDNTQPFFNIKCDLAPADELCFNAAVLMCEQNIQDTFCPFFDPVDVVNWTCHKLRIPESEIGNIATLEISAADCGEGAHFGYAYIDGICEECNDTTFGSITLDTVINYCYTDKAKVCGSYTTPTICNSTWFVDEITVPGYQIENLQIDEGGQTFCFDFPISNFPSDSCLDIWAKIVFGNTNGTTPAQISNIIEICPTEYVTYLDYVNVSSCYNNSTPGFISDDYYFVTLKIINATNLSWNIIRELIDPYPGESGIYEIASGSGNTILTLGPFRIQEGAFKLTLFINDCEYENLITPPDYCGNCTELNSVIIGNVKCITGNPDTWTFDIFVPGSGTYGITGIGASSNPYSRGTLYTINASSIGNNCLNYSIQITMGCSYDFVICPPKPCSSICEIEVNIDDISCYVDGNNDIHYSVALDASGASNKYLCYSAWDLANNSSAGSGPLTSNQIVGSFTEDIELTIYQCSNADCLTGCLPPTCYKILYIPKPDFCTQPEPFSNVKNNNNDLSIKIIPNPVHSNSFMIRSNYTNTKIIIFDNLGRKLTQTSFKGFEHKIFFDFPAGVYLLQYEGDSQKSGLIKFIKQ